MEDDIITIDLIEDIRDYLKRKTGKIYFKHIRKTSDNIIVTCPFHKDGQEDKPSATIRTTSSEKASAGLLHCFTCGESKMLVDVLKYILQDNFNAQEVESRFELNLLTSQAYIKQVKRAPLLKLPNKDFISQDMINRYKYYHPYLASRGITEEVANLYNLGFDKINNHIVFPIYNKYHQCLALGRRSILQKVYRYPLNFQKPLYGLYELSQFLRYVWIVEGPFNIWSLRGWDKQGVALLGTGTQYQYNQLLDINCKGFVLALDPDEAGMKGTKRLKEFLLSNHKEVHCAQVPIGKDINDLTQAEFKNMQVI